MSNIKTSDIVDLTEKTIMQIDTTVKELQRLTRTYQSMGDVSSLEKLKREFNGNLQYMATLFAKIKRFKGPNHTYLEGSIKRIKSEAVDIIMANGKSVTAAEKEVHSHPYYVDRMVVAEQIIQYCIKVELLYDNFNYTLQCIVQSVSLASKEFSNSKIVN
jgi:hypothetical protein